MKPLKDAATGEAVVPSGAQVVQVVAQDQSMILLRLYLGEKEIDCLLPPDMARKIGESLIGEVDDLWRAGRPTETPPDGLRARAVASN